MLLARRIPRPLIAKHRLVQQGDQLLLLLLIELCVAMFFAAQDPENLTPVFFSVFLPLLIPTIIGTIIAKRLIIKHEKKT